MTNGTRTKNNIKLKTRERRTRRETNGGMKGNRQRKLNNIHCRIDAKINEGGSDSSRLTQQVKRGHKYILQHKNAHLLTSDHLHQISMTSSDLLFYVCVY